MKTFVLFSCIKFNRKNEKDSDKSEVENDQKTGNRILQVIAAISASITMMGLGAADMWTSPALPHLQSNESEIKLSPGEASWVASIFHIGALIGYFLYPYIMDSIGRKYTLLLLFIPQLASWITTILAKDVYTLYIARIIGGMGYCAGFAVQAIYISEITEKSIRGICLVWSKVNFEIGSLIVVTIGAFCSYKDMNLLMLAIPLLFFVTFIFMPETPYYYLKKGSDKKAIRSMSKFRGTKNLKILEPEISNVKKAIIEDQSRKNAVRQLIGNKRYRKALLIVFVANATKGLSGSFAIGNYTQQIFSYSGFSLEPKYSTIVVVSLKIIAGVVSSQLIENVGRRKLYLYFGIFGAFSLGIVGLFFFLKMYLKMDNLSSISWLPLFGLTCFQVASAASLNPIPIVLTVELFPTEVKSLASAIAFFSFEIFVFLITFAFDGVNEIVGIHTTFWFYAICCIVGTYIVFCITPETRGKSLEEIQEMLDSNKNEELRKINKKT